MARLDSGGAQRARLALGVIRMVNGGIALVAPRFLVGRVQPAGSPSPAAVYAFRMFGIRTILIGRDLVRADGHARAKAVAEAPLIHACDTATATVLTLGHRVRLRDGLPLIGISAVNTLLAVVARRQQRQAGVP